MTKVSTDSDPNDASAVDKSAAPGLFLRSLEVSNFRSIQNASFQFKPGLNVILGENNSAKTAVIDCLRLLLNLGTFENKEDFIRPRNTDVHLARQFADLVEVTITGTFAANVEAQVPSRFHELLCLDEDQEFTELPGHRYSTLTLRYHVDFRFNHDKGRYESIRSLTRGGPTFENPVPAESLDAIRSIYLAPLRDLVSDRTRVGAEVERLIISHTLDEKAEDRKALPTALREEAVRRISEITGGAHEEAAGANLASYSAPSLLKPKALTFSPTGISDGLLGTLVPIFDHSTATIKRDLPLSSNGLGINQLIYASVVLSRQSDGDAAATHAGYRFFVIEEPEAHLHPQLQDSFFYALNQIKEHQIFVTSHSPTISAKTDVAKMIVMRRNLTDGTAYPTHLAQAYANKAASRKYLHKFLDVTRSQLLFARGALFVEGVTEAMLMQQFSDILDLSLRDNGVEVVVVDSNHGFLHFRPLFENTEGSSTKAAFVTDSDVKPEEVRTDEKLRSLSDSEVDELVSLHDHVLVAKGYGTFEFGLLRQAAKRQNANFMRGVLQSAMRAASADEEPSKVDAFVQDFMSFDQLDLVYKRMKQSRADGLVAPEDWTGDAHTNDRFRKAKSDFAYCLSLELEKYSLEKLRADFHIPWYIEQAIRFVASREGK